MARREKIVYQSDIDPMATELADVRRIADNAVVRTINTTWQDLRALKNNSTLVPGQKYRITDYATSTRRSDTQSAGHPFDIIVTAVSASELAAEASAAPRSGNSYFANADLGKWRLWYSLENDTNRFDWATSDGKGVVYRMIDEFGNDCPYDFKNIQFAKPLDSTTVYCYTFDGGWNQQGARRAVDFSLDGSGNFIFGNKIAPYSVEVTSSYYMQQKLNAIVFLGYNVEQNTFAEDCRDMLFGQKTVSSANVKWNKFGNACHDNNFGSLFVWNTVGANVTECTYTYTSSTPQSDVSSPIYWCHSNTIGDSCNNITLTRSCRGNSFGALNTGINLATGCASNEFGASCAYLDIGRQSVHNAFAPGCAGADGAPVVIPANTENRSFVKTQGADGPLAKVAVTGSYNDLSDKPVIDVSLLAEVPWAELKALRDGGGLKPGRQYRITDYVATVANDENAQSANHQYDIIVTADSANKLNEHARAIRHAGDTYFEGCNLAAWDVWYCIDNDSNRFAWADATNGKGVVYRLVDEWHNDVPYDFKGIQFKAYGRSDNKWYFTFSDSSVASPIDDSLAFGGSAGNLIVGMNPNGDSKSLPQIVADGDFRNNTIKSNCRNLTFGAGCSDNVLDSGCANNIFGAGCIGNMLGMLCTNNTFGDRCESILLHAENQDNVIGADCYGCTFGARGSELSIGDNSAYICFGSNCYFSSLGTECQSITIGDDGVSITIGNECVNITTGHGVEDIDIGQSCSNISIGDACSSVKFGPINGSPKSYCQNINVGAKVLGCYITPTSTTSAASPYQNIEVKAGVSNKNISDPNVGQTFLTAYKPANSQEISL